MALINCPECGKEVSETAVMCPNCGFAVKEHFFAIKTTEIQKQQNIVRQERHERTIKTLKIIIPALILLIGVSSGIIVNNYILSKRTVFETKEDMIAYLTKCSNWKYDNDYSDECLIFHDSGFAEILNDSWSRGKIGLYHPKRGTFSIDINNYFISSTGEVVSIEKERDNKWYKSNNFSTSLESAGKALSLEAATPSLDENGNFKTNVKVKNCGKNTYNFVRLKTTLTNNSNQTYSPENEYSFVSNTQSDRTYALKPGETGECDIDFFITDKSFDMSSGQCSVSIIEYDTDFNP